MVADATAPWDTNNPTAMPRPPAGPPFALAAKPLLPPSDLTALLGHDAIAVTSPALPALTHCHTDPLEWGAVQAVAANYANVEHRTLSVNEYVLRFVDSTRAHRAVSDLRRQMADCATPATVVTDPPSRAVYRTYTFDESYVTQRSSYTSTPMTGQPTEIYALRVGRQGNVVVVVEDQGYPTDRAALILILAFLRAVPD
jgi:hypothetical protein